MNDRLQENVQWFMERLDSIPMRLHVPGVWRDRDGLGSILGSPRDNPAYEQWLYAGESLTRWEEVTVTCWHVGRGDGELCTGCQSIDEDGRPYETGVRKSKREMFVYPTRAALSRLHRAAVKSTWPGLDEVLMTYARCGLMAQQVLAEKYPVIGDQQTFVGYLAYALNRFRNVWSEERFDDRRYTKEVLRAAVPSVSIPHEPRGLDPAA